MQRLHEQGADEASRRTHGRTHLVVAVIVTVACVPPPSSHVASGERTSPQDAQRRVIAIGDRVLSDFLEVFPEVPVAIRPPGATFDGLQDDSIAAVAARQVKLEAWHQELRAIDPAALAGNRQAQLSYQVAREALESTVRKHVCREELWTVSPTGTGWASRFSTYIDLQPVGTDPLRAQALARFGKMWGYLDAQIANLREGMRDGYLAYDGSVRAVLGQIEDLLATPADKSPFLGPAERDGTPAFRAKLVEVLATSFLPAVQRYRDFLADEYLPHARSTPGVSGNPDGAACYRAALREITTLELDRGLDPHRRRPVTRPSARAATPSFRWRRGSRGAAARGLGDRKEMDPEHALVSANGCTHLHRGRVMCDVVFAPSAGRAGSREPGARLSGLLSICQSRVAGVRDDSCRRGALGCSRRDEATHARQAPCDARIASCRARTAGKPRGQAGGVLRHLHGRRTRG
jgi:hypothetical protein